MIEYLSQLFDLSGGTIEVEAEQTFADGDRVVVLDHVTASRNDKQIDFHDVLVYEIRDGKFATVTQYELDVKALEAFWA